MSVTVQRVLESVREVEAGGECLRLLVGRPGSGKSKVMRELASMRGWEYIDAQNLITEEFMDLVPKARPLEALRIMSKIMEELNARVILLDRVQMLFAPVLNLEPLDLLRQLSKQYTLVAAWPGNCEGGKLCLMFNGHTKYYDIVENYKIIQIG
ncbi:Hypothetical protein LUCI_3789 [Lucifera butyrica]|uniref:BREX-3 system P-loop-containing protein BrxF n=1 Tax=Lucifera butyrica TaxID=1351585 RepID=A0A498R704_9FIRM|nr:BREX-3 system P-loop-containing protein BrxF [Lucifera butyrica]VBB08516.1 Hypothetical protein LUCI_3789 [Lucifera butyrica]